MYSLKKSEENTCLILWIHPRPTPHSEPSQIDFTTDVVGLFAFKICYFCPTITRPRDGMGREGECKRTRARQENRAENIFSNRFQSNHHLLSQVHKLFWQVVININCQDMAFSMFSPACDTHLHCARLLWGVVYVRRMNNAWSGMPRDDWLMGWLWLMACERFPLMVSFSSAGEWEARTDAAVVDRTQHK